MTKRGNYDKSKKSKFRIKLFDQPAQTLRFGQWVWSKSDAFSVTVRRAQRTRYRCDMCEQLIEGKTPYAMFKHLRIPEWNNQMGVFRACSACIEQGRNGHIVIDQLSIVKE